MNLTNLVTCETTQMAKKVFKNVDYNFGLAVDIRPLPCNTFYFDLKIIFAHVNSIDIYERNDEKDLSLFTVYYYYGSLDTEVDSEYLLRDSNTSLADIGGYLGLFLGISCFSIFSSLFNFFLPKC